MGRGGTYAGWVARKSIPNATLTYPTSVSDSETCTQQVESDTDSRAEQSRAEQSSAEQRESEREREQKESERKQSKAEQSRAEQRE